MARVIDKAEMRIPIKKLVKNWDIFVWNLASSLLWCNETQHFPHGVRNFLIKECIHILLPSITRLVNFSLSEGHVPDGFKKAVVTPLIKKASLPVDDLKNYRPVSGLSFISKPVERVDKQLREHLHDHSTETALLMMNKTSAAVYIPRQHMQDNFITCTSIAHNYVNVQKIWSCNLKNSKHDFKVAISFVKFGV